jgi:hypothetical protein
MIKSEAGLEIGGKATTVGLFRAGGEEASRLVENWRRLSRGDEPGKPKEDELLGRLVTDWRLPLPSSGESGQMSV